MEDERNKKEPKQVKHLSFLRKWVELQRAMFHHNNALTSSHPYASQPISWPFLLRGVSFWTHNDTRQQIYFLGNPVGWWLASSLLAVFAGIIGADQLALRRGMDALDDRKLLSPYIQPRLFAFILAFVFEGEVLTFMSVGTRSRPVRERVATSSLAGSWIACGVILAAVFWCFLFFAPLTYGSPGLTVPQVQSRKWLGYDLHFAK